MWAVHFGNVDLFEWLLDKGADPFWRSSSKFKYKNHWDSAVKMIARRDLEQFKQVLQTKPNINQIKLLQELEQGDREVRTGRC